MSQSIKYCCPVCGSANTKTLRMINRGGTSYYQGEYSGSGVSFGSSSNRFGFWSGNSHGVRQSGLSVDAAPQNQYALPNTLMSALLSIVNFCIYACVIFAPARRSSPYTYILWLFFCMFIFSLSAVIAKGLGIILIIAYAYALFYGGKNDAHELWQKTWRCLRCGHHFTDQLN